MVLQVEIRSLHWRAGDDKLIYFVKASFIHIDL